MMARGYGGEFSILVMEVRRRPGSIPASSSSLAYQDELEKVSRHRGLGY